MWEERREKTIRCTTARGQTQRKQVKAMTTALHAHHQQEAERDAVPVRSSYPKQFLDDVERTMGTPVAPEIPPTPATVRAPRPFAYD
jgi:hypothetical protein